MTLHHFFLSPTDGTSFVQGSYQPELVFLSVFVAVVLSLMALQTAHVARGAASILHRRIAIVTGSVALGAGIWTMHFIGMLAFKLPAPVHYDMTLTLLSLIPGWVGALAALVLLSLRQFSVRQLGVAGVLLGAGIGAMHYTGMMAMRTPLLMRYEPGTFGLSIVVAVVLAMLALWIYFGLRALNGRVRFWASGVVMGVAIAGMHYTGMAAVRFLGTPGPGADFIHLGASYVALALSSLTLTIAIVVAALNGLVRSRALFREAENAKSRLQAIFDTAVDAIITIDPYGVVQEFSHSAERLFGYDAVEVIGRNIKILMPEPFRSAHDGYLKAYRDTQVPHIIGRGREVVAQHKDGRKFPIRLAVGRVDLPGGQRLFVGLIADISERKALEASLRESVQQAEAAAETKSRFLANMSHEIRTPMNSIIGFTDLLLRTNLATAQRMHLNTIRQSSRSLLHLINDILDTTKMDSGRLELEEGIFSLKALAFQIESSLRLGAEAKGLSLRTHYPSAMPEYFRGDQLRVLQILTNLVGNAIKFTESGSIHVDFALESGAVHIEVRDTGIGMTVDQVRTIFEPFTQADASISRRFGGTGLGTTIARQLVEVMKGRIEVESAPGEGSVFHVWLPLASSEAPAEDEPTVLADHPAGDLPSLSILIADDVPQNLELLRLVLERHGHRVVSAVDGAQAFEKYQQGHFDVVLMDVHMPGTDGREATRLIRQFERAEGQARTPVIALTASVMADDRRDARQAGMDGFAVKPLEVPRLLEEISRMLTDCRGATVVSAVRAAPLKPLLVDWDRGIALWGSRAALAPRILGFLDEWVDRYPLPDDADAKVDGEALQFSLHGIRGASGNLSLMAVSVVAATLEALCREGRVQEAARRVPELVASLSAVRTEVLRAREDTGAVGGAQAAGFDGGGRRESAVLRQAATRLLAVVASNELDDDLLARVMADLTACGQRERAQALQRALDLFDFARAGLLLQEVLESLGGDLAEAVSNGVQEAP
ncbi:MAG TPA: MHYT domain-containing protein [Castellaniella sp.]|uniref:MHYT domain-containing protein n=1 Tax=Castellaniella sp. TaxID=1955812 RepID=UPI002F044A36